MKKISICAMLAMLLLVAGAAFGQDDDEARLDFLVLKDYNGQPVRNASVVMHPVNKKGKQEKGGFEIKADGEGRCAFDGVPYGTLRVQVLASGFQTFGQDYEIDKPNLQITIRLKRPVSQYSIYTDNQNDKKSTPPPDTNAKPK